jgi:hypothetical protein
MRLNWIARCGMPFACVWQGKPESRTVPQGKCVQSLRNFCALYGTRKPGRLWKGKPRKPVGKPGNLSSCRSPCRRARAHAARRLSRRVSDGLTALPELPDSGAATAGRPAVYSSRSVQNTPAVRLHPRAQGGGAPHAGARRPRRHGGGASSSGSGSHPDRRAVPAPSRCSSHGRSLLSAVHCRVQATPSRSSVSSTASTLRAAGTRSEGRFLRRALGKCVKLPQEPTGRARLMPVGILDRIFTSKGVTAPSAVL